MSPLAWSPRRQILSVASLRSLRAVRDRVRRDRPDWVVIRRAVEWQHEPYLYAFRADEIVTLAEEHPERLAEPIEVVLDLRESGSSVVTHAWDPQEPMSWSSHSPSSMRTVRLDAEGRPTAVGEPPTHGADPPRVDPAPPRAVPPTGPLDLGDTRSSGGSAPESTAGGGAAAAPARVDVVISGEAPSEVRTRTIALVDFRIELADEARPLAHRIDGAVPVRTDEPIRVLLTTHGDAVAPAGPRLQDVAPPSSGRPALGAFEIEARAPGSAELALLFRQGGTQLGTIHLSLTVVTSDARGDPAQARAIAAPRDDADDALLVLLIDQRKEGDVIRYEYRLHSESLGFNYLSLDSSPLRDRGGGGAATTHAYVEWIYERVGAEVRNWTDARRLERSLRTLGVDMCEQLFDPDVTRRLWEARASLRMVQVTSWEPYIPWELVRLRDPVTGEVDDSFLCEYGMVRSLPGEAQPRSLRLNDWSYLAADYPHGLEQPVGQEVAYFRETLPERGVQPSEIRGTYDPFYDALEEGAFDVLHIACHGESRHDRIDDSVLVIGDEIGPEGTPRPVAIDEKTVRHEARLRERQPIVFLNACASGRHGASLTAWGGWPTAFLRAGAGVFVGTSWPVRDKPAAVFAETFYDALQAGTPLAEAASAARAATKGMGDGSWLAYKVYGHPLARVSP